MSNAEQAWKEYQEFTKANGFDEPHEQSFMAGFIAGVGDAMELPEVRAEELEEGNVYIGVMESGQCFVGVELFDPENGSEPYIQLHCFGHTEKTPAVFTSFRGPLPLGDA